MAEKREVSGACSVGKVDSCVNYRLLFLLGPWRVHTQIKGSAGQSCVRASFSCGHDDRVRVLIKDYQTGSDVLSLFTRGVAHKNKTWHMGELCSISAHCSCIVSLPSAFGIRSFAPLSLYRLSESTL